MKRRIFSIIISLLLTFITVGWIWLPENLIMIQKGTPDIYKPAVEVWCITSFYIIIFCVVYLSLKVGEKLYDYLRK